MKKNTTKTVATLALAGALLATPFAAQAASYKDVSANHWAYSQISKLSDLRIISGYDDGTFKPTRSVSYLEVLTLLKGIQNPTPAEMTQAISNMGHISDAYNVPKWAKPAVCLALQNNVISETNLKEAYKRNYINNVKNDNQFPSRELVLVYYAKALGIQPIKDTSKIKVSDIASIGNTPKSLTGDVDIKGLYAAMIEAGIFHSFGSDGKFNPASPLKREQMATITNFSYDYVAQHKATQSFEGTVEVNVVVNNVPTFSIKDKNGKSTSFILAKDTTVTLNGKSANKDAITPGSTVKVQAFPQSGGVAPYQATSVTVIGNDTKATGIVDSLKNDEVKISYTTKKDSIVDDNFKAEKTDSFKFDKNTVITSLGRKVDKNGVNLRDLVTFEANNGVLKEVAVFPYNGTVNGEFVNFEYYRFGKSRLILKLEDKKEYEFYVKDAKVAEELYNLTKSINKGYPLTLSTRYHEVVGAKALQSEISGFFEGMSLINYDNGTIDITTPDGKRSFALGSKIRFQDFNVATTSSLTPDQLYSALSDYLKKAEIELHLTGGKVDKVTVKSKLIEKDKKVPVTGIKELPKHAESSNYTSSSWAINSIDGFTAYRFDIDNASSKTKTTFLKGQLSDDYKSYITPTSGSLELKFDLYQYSNGEEDFANVRVISRYSSKEIPLYPCGNISITK